MLPQCGLEGRLCRRRSHPAGRLCFAPLVALLLEAVEWEGLIPCSWTRSAACLAAPRAEPFLPKQAPCFAGMVQSVLGSVGPRPWPHPTPWPRAPGAGGAGPVGSLHRPHHRPRGSPLLWDGDRWSPCPFSTKQRPQHRKSDFMSSCSQGLTVLLCSIQPLLPGMNKEPKLGGEAAGPATAQVLCPLPPEEGRSPLSRPLVVGGGSTKKTVDTTMSSSSCFLFWFYVLGRCLLLKLLYLLYLFRVFSYWKALANLLWILRLVYFSVVKKGGARSFLLLLWDRYSPFPRKKYYNIEDRLHMEKPCFCTQTQPRSEPSRPFRQDWRWGRSLVCPPPRSCSE